MGERPAVEGVVVGRLDNTRIRSGLPQRFLILNYIHACATGRWHLKLWKRDGKDPSLLSLPYHCQSWRHEGDCRAYCGACDFARVSAAMSEHVDWSLLVLTYPRGPWPRKRMSELFRFGLVSWSRLRKRLKTEIGDFGYIQTWEVHRDKYPHVNIALTNLHALRYSRQDSRMKDSWKQTWLEPNAMACGFGGICCHKPIRDEVGMAGYLTKLSMELTGAAKKDQVPVNAPRHFRRLRASRGMLPPRAKSEEYTGKLVRERLPVEPILDVEGGEIPLSEFPETMEEPEYQNVQRHLFT